MAIVPPDRLLQFEEGNQFRSAVSEEQLQRQAAIANFISFYQFDELDYCLNGKYGSVVGLPQLAVDGGIWVVPFDMEIINYGMSSVVPGTSGTTELDVKRATVSGGAFTSIFSVTPKIASTAAANTFFKGYSITLGALDQSWAPNATPPTGVTVGTFTSVPFQLNEGDGIKVDLIDRMVDAENCSLILHFRPR